MACLLTSGRTEPCNDGAGGIAKIYLADYLEDAFTISAGAVTAIAVGVTEVFGYELRANNNKFNEALVTDKNTGSRVNTQTLEVRLKKQDVASANELMLLSAARPYIIVKGNDGTHKLMGATEGCDLTGSNIDSGNARGDFNGYDLTFTAEELLLAPFLDSATITALEALESATVISP